MTSNRQLPMPDVNTLVAAAWPNHIHHVHARRWLENDTHQGWATCSIVQSGFIRISMNALVVGQGVPFSDALALLDRYTSDSGHTFWNSETPPAGWPQWLRDRVQGYRQVTDATLLATALHNNGVLVTLDSGVLALIPESHRARVRVIVPDMV